MKIRGMRNVHRYASNMKILSFRRNAIRVHRPHLTSYGNRIRSFAHRMRRTSLLFAVRSDSSESRLHSKESHV